MSNESSSRCPQCGAPLRDNAPAGLCPNCLMALNLETETVIPGEEGGAQSPLPPEQIAPHFPQLEILECLGRGGMGVVYKARQKSLNRFVALKLLAPERVNDAKFAERFAREAQALAALNHPNIVTIHDFGQAGGFYFLLMEFVDGVNLRQLLRARKFTPEEALSIVPPLCDALQFAHEHGIVHRDIKPENLLLDKAGRVKIADFGIAKMLGDGNGGTASRPATSEGVTQSAVGTRGYSAPEQQSSPQRVDSRADIYSLGVVFYEMLTGELPGKRIEPPSRKVHIDVRLDGVVLRALEKAPELRWQTAAEFRTQVETIAAQPGGTPAGASWTSPKSGWGYLVGQFFGFTFTSRLAFQLANFSALGFLAFLGFLPLPGLRGCFGFSGFFGLIGVAHIVESIARGRSSGTPTEKFPPFAFAIALTFAGTTLFGFLCRRAAGHVLVHWLVWAFVLVGIASMVLAFVLERFAGDGTRRFFRNFAAVSAFVIGLPSIIYAASFLYNGRQAHFRIGMDADAFFVAQLVCLSAVVLPVCGWRLSRGAWRVLGLAAIGFLLVACVIVWAYWGNQQQQSALEAEVEARNQLVVAQLQKINLKSDQPIAVNDLLFGPPVELLLTNSTMIDFDTGILATQWPRSETEPDDLVDKVPDWMQSNGFDAAYLQSPRTTEGTLEINMRLCGLTTNDWEHLTPADLATNFDSASNSVWLATGVNLRLDRPPTHGFDTYLGNLKLDRTPPTYGFQTYDGGMGILQITGVTENPRSTRIRYKLALPSLKP